MSTRTARLFQSGGSQAVRLPAEFRFGGDVVYVRRDERTGDVILSASPAGRWADFVAARERLGPAPEDFLGDRDQPIDTRDPFEGA
ncbi:MAG: AbrB/MazE/SpoVT family DNA-binding domain-containing protein [Myxococcota bacterium]